MRGVVVHAAGAGFVELVEPVTQLADYVLRYLPSQRGAGGMTFVVHAERKAVITAGEPGLGRVVESVVVVVVGPRVCVVDRKVDVVVDGVTRGAHDGVHVSFIGDDGVRAIVERDGARVLQG